MNLTKDELYINWKYNDKFVLKLLKKIYSNWFDDIALEYWISKEKVEQFKIKKNTPDYLSEYQIQEIINSAPKYVVDLVKQNFPENEVENALIVCFWESSFRDRAINYNSNSVDRWLFQINSYYHWNKYLWENIFDPKINVRVAKQVFEEAWNSWKPWVAAKKFWLA